MMGIVMARWWLTLMMLVVAVTAPVAAQPGQLGQLGQPALASPSSSLGQAAVTTDAAGAAVREASARIVQFGALRAPLKKRYRDELDAIDRLKNQRVSWRRDRELRDSLSSSLDTANQLSTVER